MTNREKLLSEITDRKLHRMICRETGDCSECPLVHVRGCQSENATNGPFKKWLDEEVEDD